MFPRCVWKATIDKYIQKRQPPTNIDVHGRALATYLAELRDALALAHTLERTLVLPRWNCYCDRLWSGSDDIFHFGCMYPGAQDGNFVPFGCPMDHVLSPDAWRQEAYRDPAFLENSKLPSSIKDGVIDVHILERSTFDVLPQAARHAALPLGTTDEEARTLLSSVENAPVLRIPHARGLLCGLKSADAIRAFNERADKLLQVPPWSAKCHSPCQQELAKWLTPEQRAGARGNFFFLNVPRPPRFQLGKCVTNV